MWPVTVPDKEAYARLVAVSLGKHCPLTGGREVRVTRDGFIRACKRQQQEARAWVVSGHIRPRGRTKAGRCLACRGNQIPVEVIFLKRDEINRIVAGVDAEMAAHRERAALREKTTIEQEQDMGAKRKCEACGMEKMNLSQCSGDLVCSACASLYGAVRHRMPSIAAAVRKFGREQALLSALGLDTAVAVSVESELLERMAKLVGYTGTSGDELVAAIERAVEGVKGSQDCGSCPECTSMIDITRHVGASMGTDTLHVAKMVAHSEAILDELSSLVGAIEPAEVAGSVAALIQAYDKLRGRNDELALGLSALSERISELEGDGLHAEQVFAHIREVIGNDALAAAELPSAVEALLRRRDTPPECAPLVLPVGSATSLDSHLLDLALDAMRGQITGLDPDRIAMLREVG